MKKKFKAIRQIKPNENLDLGYVNTKNPPPIGDGFLIVQ